MVASVDPRDYDRAVECEETERLDEAEALLEGIAFVDDEQADEELLRVKEMAISRLGDLYGKRDRAEKLGKLVKATRTYLPHTSKAKAAKLVRSLMDVFLDLPKVAPMASTLCEEYIAWARAEKRSYLRQALEARLIALFLQAKDYKAALKLASALLKELKKLDDKALLVEVHLTESMAFHALSNIPKAKAALTAARTAGTAIYCPPRMQAALDLQSGILLSEEHDFKTAYSYFYEAFEGYDSSNAPAKAVSALKYMLLCKVILNQTEDVQALIQGKLALKYAGRELDSMLAVAKAHHARSLADFEKTAKEYNAELSDDPIVKAHLAELYDTLMEQNIARLIEPFSKVEIAHVAKLIDLPVATVETKLSQMILDKKLEGILDQGAGCLIVYDPVSEDKTYTDTLTTITHMEKVVDSLYKRAQKLN